MMSGSDIKKRYILTQYSTSYQHQSCLTLIQQILPTGITWSIYDIAVMCYIGGEWTSPIQNMKIMSYLGVVLTPPLQNWMVTSQEGVKC